MKLYDYEAIEQIYTSDELEEMENIISRCKRMGKEKYSNFEKSIREFNELLPSGMEHIYITGFKNYLS